MHARAKWLKTWSLGGGISGGGERGEHSHHWTIVHNPNQGQSLVSGQPLFGDWNQHHPIMSMLSGHVSWNKRKKKIKYQLLPLYLHRQNQSERSIQTLKSHFITCLCAADPEYPEKQWDRFLPQANFTLNIHPNYCFNPKLSAYAAFHDMFDYNKTPISPLGTRFLVHKKTTNCCTWTTHDTNGWYIGPALKQHRCVECYTPSNHRTRITDKVEFISTVIPIPKTNSEYYIRQSITDIIALFSDPKPTVT